MSVLISYRNNLFQSKIKDAVLINIQKRKRFILISSLVLIINYVLDKGTKLLAIAFLRGKPPISFLNDLIVLTYAENTGAFLSFGSSFNIVLKSIIMLIIPMAVCLFGIYWCMLKEKYMSRCIILSTIIGGGLGNLIDRIIHNFTVVDFLNFGIGKLRTGVLNIADLSVTFGVIIFVLFDYFLHKKDTQTLN